MSQPLYEVSRKYHFTLSFHGRRKESKVVGPGPLSLGLAKARSPKSDRGGSMWAGRERPFWCSVTQTASSVIPLIVPLPLRPFSTRSAPFFSIGNNRAWLVPQPLPVHVVTVTNLVVLYVKRYGDNPGVPRIALGHRQSTGTDGDRWVADSKIIPSSRGLTCRIESLFVKWRKLYRRQIWSFPSRLYSNLTRISRLHNAYDFLFLRAYFYRFRENSDFSWK